MPRRAHAPTTRWLPATRLAVAAGAGLPAAGCAFDGALAPRGQGAADVASLWWVMLAMATCVYVVTIGLLLAASLRRRRGEPGEARVSRIDRRFIVGGGILLPSAVLLPLLVLNVQVLASQPAAQTLEIEVVANQFWWEIRYPGAGLVTANQIHLPVGEDVVLRLRSDDVVHSFWVPQLAGKRDLVPGRENTLTLRADEPGVYRGQCAEYCGIQHANMALHVVAEPPDDFEAWLEAAAEPAAEPATAAAQRGRDTFFDAGCAACHAVRGTPADGQIGPDLTLFADRLTIGAGAAPNDRGHLGGWVVDSQSIKPGNEMPPMEVESARLQDLLIYLEGLGVEDGADTGDGA